MSTIGAVARSVCNPPQQALARLNEQAERSRIYYIALYAEMERCRVAQVPMLIGIDIDYGIPNAPAGVEGATMLGAENHTKNKPPPSFGSASPRRQDGPHAR